MEHPIAAGHRQLDSVFAETRRGFQSGETSEASEAFERLREAVDTHFEQEDLLYFPAIGALRPDLKSELERFGAVHGAFRSQMARVARDLETGSVQAAKRAFEALAEAFGRHEVEEEDLLRSIETEITAHRQRSSTL